LKKKRRKRKATTIDPRSRNALRGPLSTPV
jgi:hypothetical protein